MSSGPFRNRRPRLQFRRKHYLLLLLFAFGVFGLFLVLHPEPVEILSSQALPISSASKPSLPRRLLTPVWGQLRRLKLAVLGPKPAFNLTVGLIDFTDPSLAYATNFNLPMPSYSDTNGLRIWILSQAQLQVLWHGLEQAPGIDLRPSLACAVSDRTQTQLWPPFSAPPRMIGPVVRVLPRARRQSTDLTMIAEFNEAVTNHSATPSNLFSSVVIRTNLLAAARLQLPEDGGAFILNDRPATADGRSKGILLSAAVQRRKK